MQWATMPRIVVVFALVLTNYPTLVHANDVTVRPVEKVITLLQDLLEEVKDDGKKEAEAYGKFLSFCKASTESKSSDIAKGEDKTDDLSSTIEAKTAERKEKKDKILERLGKQESLSSELDDSKTRCQKEHNLYNAKNLEITKALDGLRAAHKALKNAKTATGASSLLAIRSSDHEMAHALRLVQKSVRQSDAAFLQQQLSVDPKDGEYKWRSGGIEHILKMLQEKYKDHKDELDAEWTKTDKSCQETKATLSSDIETNKDSVTKLKEKVDDLSQDIAKTKDDLVSEQTALEDAKEYLKDLTSKCETGAKDWEQRKGARADEAEALAKALKILQGQVEAADKAANKRALLLNRHPARLQAESRLDEPAGEAAEDVTAWLHAGASSFLQVSKSQAASKEEEESTVRQHRQWLVSFVQKEGRRLGSTALASLALRIAGDPFGKVKDLIQQLIERLLDESTGEATKKGFCDEQVGKAEKERDYSFEAARKLSAEVSVMKAQKDDLDTEVDELEDRVDELKKERTEAQNTREKEHKVNVETLQKAKEGLESVTDAYDILKDVYGQATPDEHSRAKSVDALLQASPVDEDIPDVPEGEYEGKQEASKSILGLLQIILSDFDRTLKKTEEAEAQSAADFEDLMQKLEADIAGQSTKRQLDMQDSKTIETTMKKKLKDTQLAMDVVDATLKRLEELQPMCMGNGGMSFEERTKKREAEIASLKDALCKLDTDGVESDCT